MSITRSPIDGRPVSSRRRYIWDSVSITAASINEQSFFTDATGKDKLFMDPLIDGRLPNNQRMIVKSLQVAFPAAYDLGDDTKVLDQMTVKFIVNDNRVEATKLEGLPRDFPAGGGIDGQFASGDATGNINQQNMNNGLPTPNAMFFFDDMPVVIEEQVTFSVEVNIPAVMSGLTTGRMYVSLMGAYEFLVVVPARGGVAAAVARR
jgi:hypothetical protein